MNGQVWAPLRNAGEMSQITAAIADFPGIETALQKRYRCLTASQINYILGDTGRSFVVGVGRNYPKSPHTREGFCAFDMEKYDCNYDRWFRDEENPQIVVGAMVAGPTLTDQYEDSRSNYQSTEIAIDFQTAFVSALTAALSLPEEFWHEGDLSELEMACDAIGFRGYDFEV